MRIAKNEHGELVYCEVGKLLDNNQHYFCPKCGEPLILNTNQRQLQYFSHQANKYSSGETTQHKNGKIALSEWLKQAGYQTTLELTMENHEQRADVICEDAQTQIVVEYQCSPIPAKELTKRDKGYQNLGYQTLWILGENYYKQQQLNDTLAYCMLYHPHFEYFLVFLVENNLLLKTHLQLDQYTKKVHYQEIRLPLKKYQAKKMLDFLLSSKKGIPIKGDYRQEYFTKERKHQILLNTQEENRQFLLALYLAHIHLFDLPQICWQLPKYSVVFKSANYLWRGYIMMWLAEQSGNKISLGDVLDEVNRLIHTNRLRLYPTYQSKRLKKELQLFLKELKEQGIVKEIGHNHWIIKNNFEIKSEKW
ncbi:Competence protein CoiA-like family, contains a predicted nuclease domain [Granulicatella balaenopterae]|uniref:Competence protein CoiA-like family, contains a predicted nuclease domain n=1 Tax=Granulicatella balaenopterae TaxID=137733 RepID=A0A1H9MMH7_9LACT|nr:competence protein CoiA family protein [Granulicatella balaenopterae]SER24914.1 Competence protein CoiA-like family, contains a predicted nuclease domain [Granulicatella balaenopterae]